MDKILAIQEKCSAPNFEEVKEIIRTATVQLGRLNRDDKERFLEERKKLEGLKEKIVDQQDRLSIEVQNLNSMDNELTNHNKLMKELEAERNRYYSENSESEAKRKQLKIVKPSTTDQKILELGRRKYDYYKVLTGIRWDYPSMKTAVKGFVTNGENYLKPFCFDINDDRIESKLWREIEKRTNHNMIKCGQKENSSPNTCNDS
ncbi:hypothetical protein PV325_007784 [Microctonus aethiopoides]|uniref:Kinetochore protein Spc24 n=1 Tax=Microctonus aethiopoides TaxID=144406 RepID=A0AA39KRN8_9HYME|nr:hypothetical protein PV325_007784 [Microctonus aethiopoides]KAK0097747.1 hypothetical protein PV326_014050 [Microctonus aethiopoides]KAK0171086.1 hypothetical protein PV328_008848 [Microctonus aethiopoides]